MATSRARSTSGVRRYSRIANSTWLMIREPPGAPSTSTPFSSSTKVGVMLESGLLPGSMRLAAQPKRIRQVGPQCEIVHLIVEQHPGPVGDDSRTEKQIDRDGRRDAIAL